MDNYCIENDLSKQQEMAAIAKVKEGYLKKEILEVLQLLFAYGKIKTITNVKYPLGTHEQALQRALILMNRLKGKI